MKLFIKVFIGTQILLSIIIITYMHINPSIKMDLSLKLFSFALLLYSLLAATVPPPEDFDYNCLACINNGYSLCTDSMTCYDPFNDLVPKPEGCTVEISSSASPADCASEDVVNTFN